MSSPNPSDCAPLGILTAFPPEIRYLMYNKLIPAGPFVHNILYPNSIDFRFSISRQQILILRKRSSTPLPSPASTSSNRKSMLGRDRVSSRPSHPTSRNHFSPGLVSQMDTCLVLTAPILQAQATAEQHKSTTPEKDDSNEGDFLTLTLYRATKADGSVKLGGGNARLLRTTSI